MGSRIIEFISDLSWWQYLVLIGLYIWLNIEGAKLLAGLVGKIKNKGNK